MAATPTAPLGFSNTLRSCHPAGTYSPLEAKEGMNPLPGPALQSSGTHAPLPSSTRGWNRDKAVTSHSGHAERGDPQGQGGWPVVQGPGRKYKFSGRTPHLLGQDPWGFCGILRLQWPRVHTQVWEALLSRIAVSVTEEAGVLASPCPPGRHAHLCTETRQEPLLELLGALHPSSQTCSPTRVPGFRSGPPPSFRLSDPTLGPSPQANKARAGVGDPRCSPSQDTPSAMMA